MKDKSLACYQDLVPSLPRLPENLLAFLKDHIANLQININHTDGLNGYGSFFHWDIRVMMYYEECGRWNCNYHSLFYPNPKAKDENDFCHHHSLKQGYTEVFSYKSDWVQKPKEPTLEEAFQKFLDQQGTISESIKPLFIEAKNQIKEERK